MDGTLGSKEVECSRREELVDQSPMVNAGTMVTKIVKVLPWWRGPAQNGVMLGI